MKKGIPMRVSHGVMRSVITPEQKRKMAELVLKHDLRKSIVARRFQVAPATVAKAVAEFREELAA